MHLFEQFSTSRYANLEKAKHRAAAWSPSKKAELWSKNGVVRERGLEPPPLTGPDPKSGASAISPLAQTAPKWFGAAWRLRCHESGQAQVLGLRGQETGGRRQQVGLGCA